MYIMSVQQKGVEYIQNLVHERVKQKILLYT